MNRKVAAALAVLGLTVFMTGGIACLKQRQGEHCQVDSDCEAGLTCNKGKDPPVCDKGGGGSAIDAELPIDAPDAPPDQ